MQRGVNETQALRAVRVELLMAVARDTAASLQMVTSQLQAELAGATSLGEDLDAAAQVSTGQVDATSAGPSVDAVQALQAEVLQLREAMTSRAVIEQAKGVLMARCGCDADTAFAMLCTVSRTERRKVRDVATTVVTGAVMHQPPPGIGPERVIQLAQP